MQYKVSLEAYATVLTLKPANKTESLHLASLIVSSEQHVKTFIKKRDDGSVEIKIDNGSNGNGE